MKEIKIQPAAPHVAKSGPLRKKGASSQEHFDAVMKETMAKNTVGSAVAKPNEPQAIQQEISQAQKTFDQMMEEKNNLFHLYKRISGKE